MNNPPKRLSEQIAWGAFLLLFAIGAVLYPQSRPGSVIGLIVVIVVLILIRGVKDPSPPPPSEARMREDEQHLVFEELDLDEARRRVEALIEEGKLITVDTADNRPPHVVERFAPLLRNVLTRYKKIELSNAYYSIGWDEFEQHDWASGFVMIGGYSDGGHSLVFVAPGDETIYDTYECLPNDPEATTYRSIYHFLLEVSETSS